MNFRKFLKTLTGILNYRPEFLLNSFKNKKIVITHFILVCKAGETIQNRKELEKDFTVEKFKSAMTCRENVNQYFDHT